MTYAEAKKVAQHASDEAKTASLVLQTFPKKANGMTPDNVRLSPDFQAAKARYASAAAEERRVNQWFYKIFGKEIRAERRARGR